MKFLKWFRKRDYKNSYISWRPIIPAHHAKEKPYKRRGVITEFRKFNLAMYTNPIGVNENRPTGILTSDDKINPPAKNINKLRFNNVIKPFSISGIQEPAYEFVKGGLELITHRVKIGFSSLLGKFSRLQGATYFRVGSIPPKEIISDLRFLQYVNRNFESIDKHILDEIVNHYLTPRVVVSGGFTSNFPSFVKMAEGNEHSNTISAEELLRYAIESRLRCFSMPDIDIELNEHMLDNVNIKEKSFNGIMTSNYFGNVRKTSLPFTISAAKKLFRYITTRSTKYSGLWAVFGREKDIKLSESTFGKGTRPVLAPEEVLTLIGGLVGQTYVKALRCIKDSLIYIGKSFENANYEAFHHDAGKYFSMISEDFTSFDASIDKEHLLAALSIIRCSFPDDDKYDRLFYFIATSLIYKTVAFPPGIIIELRNGLPSGHPLTSLVGTIVNWLSWNRVLMRVYGTFQIGGKFLWKSRFSGDDSQHLLTYLKGCLKKIDHEFSKTPLKIEPTDGNYYPVSSVSLLDNSDFLKRCVTFNSQVYWNRKALIKKLVYTTAPRTDLYNTREWIYHWVDTAAGDYCMNDFLRGYLNFICYNPGRTSITATPLMLVSSRSVKEFDSLVIRGTLRTSKFVPTTLALPSRVSEHITARQVTIKEFSLVSAETDFLIFTSVVDSNAYGKDFLLKVLPSDLRSLVRKMRVGPDSD